MTIVTNGNVPASMLTGYQGVQVSRSIYPALSAAGSEIRALGFTFSVILPVGGYRSLQVQEDMAERPGNYNIQPGVQISAPGSSRHGFGKAVDVYSSAPHGRLVSVMRGHGFSQYSPISDPNHFGYGNELTADGLSAAGTGTLNPIDNAPLSAAEGDPRMRVISITSDPVNPTAYPGVAKNNVFVLTEDGYAQVVDINAANAFAALWNPITVSGQSPTIIPVSAEVAIVNFQLIDHLNALRSKGAPVAGGSTLTADAIASSVKAALAAEFDAIPTAGENAAAAVKAEAQALANG